MKKYLLDAVKTIAHIVLLYLVGWAMYRLWGQEFDRLEFVSVLAFSAIWSNYHDRE